MRKNVAGQSVDFQMISKTDGSDVTTGTPTVSYKLDGGTYTTGSGTSSHDGSGLWEYIPTQAETNGDKASYQMVLSGAVSQTINVWPVSFDPTQANLAANVTQLGGVTQSATDLKDFADAGYDPATNKVQGVVLVDTTTALTNLPSIPTNWLTAAGINAGAFTAGKFAAASLNGKGDWNIGKTGYLISGTKNTLDDLNDLSAAQVNAECDTAIAGYDGPTNAEMEARTPTAAQLAYITRHAATALPVTFTGGTTTTAILGNIDGSAASSTDDVYNSRLLVFNAGTLDVQVCQITDYTGSTKTATISAVTTAVTSSHTAVLV